MQFYIASKLANYIQVQALAAKLKAAGWKDTYDWTADWTAQGAALQIDEGALQSIAKKEAEAIAKAHVVIVLSPQGRGTHVELGMAIALGKAVFLCHADDTYFQCDDNTVSFYMHPNVIRLVGSTEELAAAILQYNDRVCD